MPQPESYAAAMAAGFEDEMQKIAQVKAAALSPDALKTIALVGGAALGYEALRRANHDRRMGRAVRMQQGY